VPGVWIVRPDGTGVRKIALPLLDRLDTKAFRKLKRKLLRQCQKSSNRRQCKRKAAQRAKQKTASQRLTPVWSPDSTKLVFQRLSLHGKELWTVSADGTGLSKLTHTRNRALFGWLYAWGTAPLEGL
jgi:hypothetical protein